VRRRVRFVGAVIAGALALAAVVAFFLHVRRQRPPGVPPELVPPAWEQLKTSEGHRVHVEDHGVPCGDCHDYARAGFVNPGPGPCAKCHAKQAARTHAGDTELHTDCLTCHAFTSKPTPTCMSCHTKAHGAAKAIVVHAGVACTDCHRVHRAIALASCTTCHAKETTPEHDQHAGSRGCFDCHTAHAPAAAAKTTCRTCHATPAGHASCFGCHRPHVFVAGGDTACIRCHGEKPTLAADTVSAHQDCLSCHEPHAPTRAASSCGRCHAYVQTSHPAVAGASVCTTCHAPHGAQGVIAATCTSCHRSVAASDTGAHARGVPCLDCHSAHRFARPTATVAFCGTCHFRETRLTASNAGHADCMRCHGTSAHRLASPPACGSCHRSESARIIGGHWRCTQCHEAHSGKTGKHAICTTCHARATLHGLHAVSGHASCASCHTPHGPPRADRATCTGACHTDKQSHQPAATACNGCHVFR
jgi:hypothetical protein